MIKQARAEHHDDDQRQLHRTKGQHRLKHGVFLHSVVDFQAAINRIIAEHNATEARPFVWRANPDGIIAARQRGFQELASIH